MKSNLIDSWALDDAFGMKRSKERWIEHDPSRCEPMKGIPVYIPSGPQSPEHLENRKHSLVEYYQSHVQSNSKSCIYNGVEYESYAAAARANGYKDASTIRRHLNQGIKPRKGGGYGKRT